ncbi:hypothetical protein KIW84_021070 [Lathyrus oleraceus]|uniref:Uncharacterized protein n=1 Tax=Pisum sativum TaxID=3888 RepID=A0A9D5B9H6_PEA|nr:hypothetical protein KIW84_021070 [Pisum sativum]
MMTIGGVQKTVFCFSRGENDRVFMFLVGLNKDLDEVRGRVLGKIPLPTLREIFAEIRREKARQGIMMGKIPRNSESEDSALPTRNLDEGRRAATSFASVFTHYGATRQTVQTPRVSNPSCSIATKGNSAFLSVIPNHTCVVDSGASDHMNLLCSLHIVHVQVLEGNLRCSITNQWYNWHILVVTSPPTLPLESLSLMPPLPQFLLADEAAALASYDETNDRALVLDAMNVGVPIQILLEPHESPSCVKLRRLPLHRRWSLQYRFTNILVGNSVEKDNDMLIVLLLLSKYWLQNVPAIEPGCSFATLLAVLGGQPKPRAYTPMDKEGSLQNPSKRSLRSSWLLARRWLKLHQVALCIELGLV